MVHYVHGSAASDFPRPIQKSLQVKDALVVNTSPIGGHCRCKAAIYEEQAQRYACEEVHEPQTSLEQNLIS